MPTRVTVWNWLYRHPEFFNAYARARENRADLLFEECLDISDRAQHLDNMAAVQAARLRVDTRKWAAAKLNPKNYGDRAGDGPQAPQTAVIDMPELARRIATLLVAERRNATLALGDKPLLESTPVEETAENSDLVRRSEGET